MKGITGKDYSSEFNSEFFDMILITYNRASGCPYAIQNLNKDLIPDRLLEQPQAVNHNLINSEEINNKRELKNMRHNTKAHVSEVKQLKKTNESVELKRKRGRPKKNSQPDFETKQKTVNPPKKQKRDPLTTFRSIKNLIILSEDFFKLRICLFRNIQYLIKG